MRKDSTSNPKPHSQEHGSKIRVGKRASRASRRYMTSGSRVFEKGRESGVRVFTVDAPIQLKSIALIR
jgi:hypothetical protein